MGLQLPEGVTPSLDLGDDHMLEWIVSRDGTNRIIGAMVWHSPARPPTELETPWCCGSVLWEDWGIGQRHPLWQLQGEPGPDMTLVPSILCSCGDHGYVVKGRWKRA